MMGYQLIPDRFGVPRRRVRRTFPWVVVDWTIRLAHDAGLRSSSENENNRMEGSFGDLDDTSARSLAEMR